MAYRVLITGGAGFVGSSLALAFKRDHADWTVLAFDNLKRRGSELNLGRLRAGGVIFQHGDVRSAEDFDAVGAVDLLVDCSAEPSVHAGLKGSPRYTIAANLDGTVNCLEHLRRTGGDLVFVSTSRIYPIGGLQALPLERHPERFVLPPKSNGPGWSEDGINENFPLAGHRSLYGATKMASELLINEYRAMYGLRTIINRCGVLAGPWQMGKVDQGFIALWMARHVYGGSLAYMGFGGEGLQVRDVLHVDDFYDLVDMQLQNIARHSGSVYNVGGGVTISTSLQELTVACQRITGRSVVIAQDSMTKQHDVPYYVSDCQTVQAATSWRPRHSMQTLLEDVHRWLVDNCNLLEPVLSN